MQLGSEGETLALGQAIAALIRRGDVIALSGDLGAGKTTLSRGVLRGLGFGGDVPSPTFTIVQPYEQLAVPVWHVDLYRIEDSSELEQLALDDAREEVAMIVEWPERMGSALWADSLQLRLQIEGVGARSLTAIVPPAWESRWPPR
jgi:tRNA threonylcarbamoyladenosine biosynthesis protein TsaE